MAADQDVRRTAEEKNGALKTLLGEALAKAVAPKNDGQQFALFATDERLPDDDKPAEAADPERGPGRPPGARNKATDELRRFVRAKYGDPGLLILQRIFTDPKALQVALGAESAWDVAKAQMEWALRMAPYFWQAMPAEVKVQTKGQLAVAIGVVPGLPAGDRLTDLDPFGALLAFAKENQGVITIEDGQSHADPLHVEPDNAAKSEG